MPGPPECKAIFVRGRWYRTGPVSPIAPPKIVAEISPAARLRALGLFFAAGSPTVTVEELSKATIRVFEMAETGWLAEARFKPGDLPIYHYISEEEAELIKAGEISVELIARLFEPAEPIME